MDDLAVKVNYPKAKVYFLEMVCKKWQHRSTMADAFRHH